jgi:hypothetical protein
MIYLYGYREIQLMAEERRLKAQAKLLAMGKLVPDSFTRSHPAVEADVVEVLFGTHCEQIGA